MLWPPCDLQSQISGHAVERKEIKKETKTYQILFVCKHQYDIVKHRRLIYACLQVIHESIQFIIASNTHTLHVYNTIVKFDFTT